MVACRLGRCAVPKVRPLQHSVCICILAVSPPHHHVGGLKQAGNVGTAVWWAMNFFGNGASTHAYLQVVCPRFTRLPPPVPAEPCGKANEVACTYPWMALHCYYRLYRPSCASEERPGSLLWTFGVLVCCIVCLYANTVLSINPY